MEVGSVLTWAEPYFLQPAAPSVARSASRLPKLLPFLPTSRARIWHLDCIPAAAMPSPMPVRPGPATEHRPSGSFLKRAGPLVFARLVATAITFSIPLVLARQLSLTDYGTYKQLFLLAMTLQAVLPFGMAQSLYFFIPRADDRKPYLVQSHLFLLLGGIVGAILLLFFSEPLSRAFSNPGIQDYRLLVAPYVICTIASYPLEISLTAQGKTRAAAICYIASDSLRAIVLIAPILLGWGLRGSLIGIAALSAVRLAFVWALITFSVRGKWWDTRAFLRQLSYAAPFGAAMVLNQPQQAAHQYAVSSVVAPTLFAIYAVGCFQIPLVDLLYQPTSEILMVRIAELERAERLQECVWAFREAASKLAYLFFPLGALLWVTAPEFIGALFGPRFLPAVPIFRISLLGVILPTLPMDGVLRARNETRYLFWSYFLKALVTVPLVYFTVKHWGMIGGIAGWAIAELFGKLTLFLRIPRALSAGATRLGFADVVPGASLAKAAVASATAALALLALQSGLPTFHPSWASDLVARAIPMALLALAFGGAYLLALRLLGIRPMRAFADFRGHRPPVAIATNESLPEAG